MAGAASADQPSAAAAAIENVGLAIASSLENDFISGVVVQQFATENAAEQGELRIRDMRAVVQKFAS